MKAVSCSLGNHKLGGGKLGHQGIDLITSFIISEWFGFERLYSPFTNMAEEWNEYLDFGYCLPNIPSLHSCIYFPVVEPNPWGGVEYQHIVDFVGELKEDSVLIFDKSTRITMGQIFDWEDRCLVPKGLYKRVINSLRNAYWNSPGVKGKLKAKNIVIHLRRGGSMDDVTPMRYLTDEFFLNVICHLMKQDHDKHITIYSDGPLEKLDAFTDFNVDVCDGELLHSFEVFHNFVTADVLVCSNSDFSRFAGYLNEGIVIEPEEALFTIPTSVKVNRSGEFE